MVGKGIITCFRRKSSGLAVVYQSSIGLNIHPVYTNVCICIIEFESARPKVVYPTSCGSSGIWNRYLSRLFLKKSSVQPDILWMDLGRMLKSFIPWIEME